MMDDNKVAVILEDLRSQFKVFGEGLQSVNHKIDQMNQKVDNLEHKVDKLEQRVVRVEEKLDTHIEQNRLEHQQIVQIIKELDNEVQVEIKRVK